MVIFFDRIKVKSLFNAFKKSIDAAIALEYGACKPNLNLCLFEPFRGRVISDTVGLKNYWVVGAAFSREWRGRANIDNRGWADFAIVAYGYDG